MFDEDYRNCLPADPARAGRKLCDDFRRFNRNSTAGQRVANYKEFLQAHFLLQAFAHVLGREIKLPNLAEGISANISFIVNSFASHGSLFDSDVSEHTVESVKEAFPRKSCATFACRFTDDDLGRIKKLIIELRLHIRDASGLDENLRVNLLDRLETMQAELRKRILDLDSFWELVGEASEASCKLGADAKPLYARIRDIAVIVWHTPIYVEELASNAELPGREKDDDYTH